MDKVKLSTSDWSRTENFGYRTAEGLELQPAHLKKICEFHKVPATLVAVDKSYHTDTTLQVLRAINAEPEVLVEDDKIVSVLDPKSVFCDDAEFESLIAAVQEKAKCQFSINDRGVQRQAKFQLDVADDSFMGDIFKKSFEITRKPEGGVSFNTALLRLACTNGMLVNDSQYRYLFRNCAKMSDAFVATFIDAAHNFNVDNYFKSLFTKDGEFLIASVADYLGMRDTLASFTDPDLASVYYPTSPIVSHYEAQNIDIDKMSRNMLAKIPSGMTYYEAFNILTNGFKASEDESLDAKIKVSDWARPSRLSQLKASEITYHGMPQFDKTFIHSLMGDIDLKPSDGQ